MFHPPRPAHTTVPILSTLLLVTLAFGPSAIDLLAQPRGPQPPPLTDRVEIAPDRVGVRYPAGWSVAQEARAARLVHLPTDRLASADVQTVNTVAQILITVEKMRSHDDALRRLQDIRAESSAPTSLIVIGGWPALQRRSVQPREQPGGGNEEAEEREQPSGALEQTQPQAQPSELKRQMLTPARVLIVTTVVAAGDLIVRAEGRMPPDAPPVEEATVRAIEQSLTFPVAGSAAQVNREIARLRALPKARPRRPPTSTGRAGALPSQRAAARTGRGRGRVAGPLQAAGLPQRVNGGSEAEIAVSTNGQNIIIAQAGGYARSTNGGQSFTNGPVNFVGSNGDGSVAFGRSGTFYAATIGGRSTRVYASPDNGLTFPFISNAYTCPTGPDPFPCGFAFPPPVSLPFPDQEHIAADRVNLSATGQDQVYVVWRNANNRYGIVCSTTGAAGFGGRTLRTGDFPRITVGQDGRVYVVYQNGDTINVDRFSACRDGLTLQVNGALVATLGPTTWVSGAIPCSAATPQTPAMPGLDRCNDGNNLSSFMVAVDDTDANHIFVAYAQNTSPTNESVLIQDSTNGGANWLPARVVTVSNAVVARRFMPWVCAVGGVAYVNWFDRRAATATNDSLTDFFAGTALRDGAGNLIAGPERRVNTANTADNQCEAGAPPGTAGSWPGAARARTDSETCTPQQPQLAGLCFRPGTTPPVGSGQPCDFSTPACPTLPIPETCQFGLGTPKYGDYNGNACAAGRFYSIWPSATPAVPLTGPINMFFAALVVAGSQIQIPGPVVLPDACVGTSSTAVANVCNTGKTDLHVDPITSSDPQFTVVPPSSGYPVTIGPSSCFPFQVRFTPSSPGPKSAALTVPSDDTVTPSATILVSGNGTQRSIVTAIADSGDFGTVAAGSFRDQPLVISNPGGCALTITNITSNAPDFQMASVVSFPIVIAPGTSTTIPIRFRPTSFGPKSAMLTITNDDPLNSGKQVAVQGNGGAPTIVTAVVDTGSFGPVCVGATRDLNVTATNSGSSPLIISSITSDSLEFQVPQVLTFPIVVAVGTSYDIPIRFAPTTPGAKSATITIASNDPATPKKVVTMTADTPANELCHPPSFTSVGMSTGPTFGSSKTGDWTVTAEGRHLVPFGEQHTFGLQTQGEYLYYSGRHEGQLDIGLVNRWKKAQFGVFGDFKFAEIGQFKDGGVLGQASGVLDLFFSSVRVNIFGSKGFKDIGVLSTDTSLAFAAAPAGTTAVATDVEHVSRVVDTFGGGALVGVGPNTEIDGHVMWLRRQRPTPLGDGVGVMARVTHHLSSRFAVFGELTLNETLLGPTNSGRVIGGFVFGRWTRPSDLANKHTPLGTEVPRLHFDLDVRQR
jgi:hypothetical protein